MDIGGIKRVETDIRHEYLCDIIASYLYLDKREVLDHFVCTDQIDLIGEFFKADGGKYLAIFAPIIKDSENGGGDDDDETDAINESPDKLKISKELVMNLGNLVNYPMGFCVYFIRWNTANPITEDNIATCVISGFVDTRESHLLPSVKDLIKGTLLNAVWAVEGSENWGTMTHSKGSHKIRRDVLASVYSVGATFKASHSSVLASVQLNPCPETEIQKMQSVLQRPEALPKVEPLLSQWIQTVQRVIIEGEQVRQDSDVMGPTSELEHWKREEARLGHLLEQIQDSNKGVKSLITTLTVIRPRRVKTWKQLERKLSDMHHRALSNVRFLQVLDKHCSALYLSDPEGIIDALPEILGALQMIHRVSNYFKQPDKIASLVIKVSNQIVLSCKKFISESEDWPSVWRQPLNDSVISRLQICLQLGTEYQNQFEALQQRLRSSGQPEMEFSQALAFGKLRAAAQRFRDIICALEVVKHHTLLLASHAQGFLEPEDRELKHTTTLFQEAVNIWINVTYDLLDQQKRDEFQMDFEIFQKQIETVQQQLGKLLENQLAPCWSNPLAVKILRRLESLTLPGCPKPERKNDILNAAYELVQQVAQTYESCKYNPPLARDMPPISGRMQWAIGLLKCLESRIQSLQIHSDMLSLPDGCRLVLNYNSVARTLFNYSFIHHKAWLEKVNNDCLSFLDLPLLGRMSSSRQLYVNYHLDVVIAEGRHMLRMGFPPSQRLKELLLKANQLQRHRDQILYLVTKIHEIKEKIRPELQLLTTPYLATVDKVVDPGLNLITWASLNVENFIEDFKQVVDDLEVLIERCNDLCRIRLEEQLQSLGRIVLIEYREDQPQMLDDFLQRTKFLCTRAMQTLQSKNFALEEAINDLLNLLQDNILFKEDGASSGSSLESEEFGAASGAVEGVYSRCASQSSAKANKGSLRRRSTTVSLGRPQNLQCHRFLLRRRLRDAAQDVLRHYNVLYVEALVDLVRDQLEALHTAMMTMSTADGPYRGILRVETHLNVPKIEICPSFKDIQEMFKHLTEMVLTIFKAIPQWSRSGKSKPYPMKWIDDKSDQVPKFIRPKHFKPYKLDIIEVKRNYYSAVAENPEVSRVVSLLCHIETSSLAQV